MQDLILGLKKSNSARAEKRTEMLRIDYYQKLFNFLESRFENGGEYEILNYFENYKLTTKDKDGNDKVVYGLISTNGKTYVGLNDLAFAKKLYKRTIIKVDNEETTEYKQLEKSVYQGDLAILFDKFKKQYKDALVAFDLLFVALAKHNECKFVTESFIYPTETYQRFKGEYTTANFYLFNFKIGGLTDEKINEIFADICKDYETACKAETEPQVQADAKAEPKA